MPQQIKMKQARHAASGSIVNPRSVPRIECQVKLAPKTKSLALAGRLTALQCYGINSNYLGGFLHPARTPMPRQRINGS